MILVWTLAAYLSGSFMFSYWFGLMAKINLQERGDGNPGAINLLQGAGIRYGLAGILLDFMKAYLPILLYMKVVSPEGYAIVPVAAAPIIGHMFSPFLKLKGGKAIAATFGVWSALTGFEVSLALGVILFFLLLAGRLLNRGKPVSSEADGFQVVLGMLLLSVYVYAWYFSMAILVFWFINFLLLVYAHRRALQVFIARRVKKKTEWNARKIDG